MMKENILNDFKTILNSKWFVAFFLMMISFLYDIVLFRENGMSFSTMVYSIILIGYYCGWLFSLYLGRVVTITFLILNFIVFCVFKEYYKFHTIPLKFEMILSLYKDGLIAGFKNKASLFDSCFFIFFILLIIQIKIVCKHIYFSLKKAGYFLLFFITSGFLYGYIIWGTEAVIQLKQPRLFLSYQQGLLYKLKWPIEFFLPKDNHINRLILTGNESLRKNMKYDDVYLSFLPNNIYLIQVESLTTKAVENMPFFKELISSKNTKYTVDKNHEHCIGSANTDFMMMSGYTFDCTELHTLVFYAYPTEIYQKTKPLSLLLKEKGYKTNFIHGYKGDFFNRYTHYKNMSYDDVFFLENFSKNIATGEWGIGDYSLLKAIPLIKLTSKNFYFIITSGMHPPYNVPEDKQENNTSRTDINSYLNAALFLDNGLKELYQKAPDDSLFIVYGDHNVPDIKAFDTPVLITYKGKKELNIFGEKEKGFKGTIYFINSLFDERN